MSDVDSYLNFVPKEAPRGTITQVEELYERFSDKQPVTIRDVRDSENQFKLDVNGFEFFNQPLPKLPAATEEFIKELVYPDTVNFLKEKLGASHVEIFEHVHRTAHTDNQSETTGQRGPSYVVHVDHSKAGANKILCDTLPAEEVERRTKKCWALVNVWRPMALVEKDPLAVCDAQTARDEDLMEFFVDFYDPSAGPKNRAINVQWTAIFCKHAARQNWYYKSNMTTDDLVCFKIFDTKDDNDVWCMHSAFPDPKTVDCPRPRQSVEIRCFLFFDD